MFSTKEINQLPNCQSIYIYKYISNNNINKFHLREIILIGTNFVFCKFGFLVKIHGDCAKFLEETGFEISTIKLRIIVNTALN